MDKNLQDFEERKAAIWGEVEKEYGRPFPQLFRDYLEREEVGSPEDYIDGDPEGEEQYLASLQSVAEKYANGLILAGSTKPSTDENGKSTRPQKIYRGPFERRLYLFKFVLNQNLNTRRINWKRTLAAWNKAHSSDQMSKDALKREFYRAFRDDLLMVQYWVLALIEYIEFLKEDNPWMLDWFEKWRKENLPEYFLELTLALRRVIKAKRPIPPFIKENLYRLFDCLDSIIPQVGMPKKEAKNEGSHNQEG